MRRRLLLTIPAFLLLGALATIGVAWSIAWFTSPRWVFTIPLPDRAWPAHAPPGWRLAAPPNRGERFGATMDFFVGTQPSALTQPASSDAVPTATPFDTLVFSPFQSGLPWRALRCEGVVGPMEYGVQRGFMWRGVMFPLRPQFPGFVIDTLFYAAIIGSLAFTRARLRRRSRARRGLCIKCGYPVGASAICTECGTALPPLPARRESSGGAG